jgi:hypothetical protein
MTITIDLPPDVADTLTHKAAQEGRDIAGYVRQLVVKDAGHREEGPDSLTPRIPGLHAGQYWIAEDFDAPLPDSFWLGEESAMGESGK